MAAPQTSAHPSVTRELALRMYAQMVRIRRICSYIRTPSLAASAMGRACVATASCAPLVGPPSGP